MYQKGESARKYLNEITIRNGRTQEEINKKAQDIEQTRQDHHMLFKVALETIMRKLKDFESDCDAKGLTIVKYGHLDAVVNEEQVKIQSLNEQIAEVERSIQECQNAFKELVKRELGELHEQKNHYKAKYEEAKYRSRDLMTQIDDFKKRFIQ